MMSDQDWKYSSVSNVSDKGKCEYLETFHRSPEVVDLEVIAMQANTMFFRYKEAAKVVSKPPKIKKKKS
jgi:hypothetical protein